MPPGAGLQSTMRPVSSLCLIVILVRGFGCVLDTLRIGAIMTIAPLVLGYFLGGSGGDTTWAL